MKLYKVTVGVKVDEYGHNVEKVIEKYFINKVEAEKLFKSGEYEDFETRITVIYEDGTAVLRSIAPAWCYEERKAHEEKNEKVELVKVIKNRFKFEEIETED